MSNTFAELYERNEWGYGSGVGSLPLNNVDYIKFIRMFIEHNNVRSVLDLGCGDWQFSRFIDWAGVAYIGLDIVPEVIALNQKLFGRANISFAVLPPEMELPTIDLFICKDVFQHLPNNLIRRYIDLFKARSCFLLITNDHWPAEELTNADIAEGSWRPVRLDLPPFSEVAPIVLSWTIEWGGWKPTRKSTCLITGSSV